MAATAGKKRDARIRRLHGERHRLMDRLGSVLAEIDALEMAEYQEATAQRQAELDALINRVAAKLGVGPCAECDGTGFDQSAATGPLTPEKR